MGKTNPKATKQKIAAKAKATATKKASKEIENKLVTQEESSASIAKSVFIVGQEMSSYRDYQDGKWDFGHLLKVTQKLLSDNPGKKAYLFGQAEPKDLKTRGNLFCIENVPVIVVVLCEEEPPSKLGITTVQKEEEEIVPMKDFGMSWCPASAIVNSKIAQKIYFLDCKIRFQSRQIHQVQELALLQAIPYILQSKDVPESPEDVTFAKFTYLSAEHNKTITDVYEKGLVSRKEWIGDMVEEHQLDPSEQEKIDKCIKAAFKTKRTLVAHDHALKLHTVTSEPNQTAWDQALCVKVYPSNLDEKFKCTKINRYYGDAFELF